MSKKNEEDHEESKKDKKGKYVTAGGTIRTGRSLEDEDSGDSYLDIGEAMMRPKTKKKAKLEAAS